MLLEFLSHAMSFDMVWIASLIMGNLHWLFAISAFVLISNGGKRWLWPFLTMFALLWAIVDFAGIMGWIMVPIIFFTVVVSFLMQIFINGTILEKHSLKIIVVLFLALSFVHTFLFSLEVF